MTTSAWIVTTAMAMANYPLDYYSSNEQQLQIQQQQLQYQQQQRYHSHMQSTNSNMNEHCQQEVCKFCKHTQAKHSGVERRHVTLMIQELAIGEEMFSIIQSAGAFDEDVCIYFFRQLYVYVYIYNMYTFAQVSFLFFFPSILLYASFPIVTINAFLLAVIGVQYLHNMELFIEI
ncbi:hypothetical protein RFI_32417 [Reticulomyxa filosa]|uniref:Uncharacterized protein n=1 Tax=Reticulomyxa filosa TaxID=46433 RepID=X6LTM0_RETFI|nr:hypothetical protein RFI_32417 [Reticulomyxa filosa]|eukprot:ETO04979.1 hypothetical protein RFI_32417 [Reticulomyxa filosa]